jgi:hypothetical protein
MTLREQTIDSFLSQLESKAPFRAAEAQARSVAHCALR